MKQKRKILILAFFIILLTLFAIAREYIFVWINAAINNYYRTTNNSEIPTFFLQLEKQELYYLKWILSFVFGGLNIFVSVISIFIFFNSKNYALFTLSIYGLIGFILVMGYVISKLFEFKELIYDLLHDLLLLLQTPILFILIFPLLLFYKKQQH
ncbi:MAG: hypothetical protein ACK4IK_07880 [Bacteroidia bacterium]